MALALGKTVGELEGTMSARELLGWQTFYKEEPFGDVRADLRAGIIARTVAQAVGGNKKVTALDFMPIIKAEHDRQVREDAAALAAKFNAMMFSITKNVRIMPRRPKR